MLSTDQVRRADDTEPIHGEGQEDVMKQAGLLTSVTILAVTGSVQAPVALAAAWREATQVDQVTGDDLPASQRSRLERARSSTEWQAATALGVRV